MNWFWYRYQSFKEINDYQKSKYEVLGILEQKNDFVLLKAKQILGNQEVVAISTYEIPKLPCILYSEEKIQEIKDQIFKQIMAHLNVTGHPSVIGFKEVFVTQRYLCIVMELPIGQNLQQKISNSKHFSEKKIRNRFQQLVIFQKFLHENKIVNRSIGLDNTFHVKTCYNFFDLKTWEYDYLHDIFNDISDLNPVCKNLFQSSIFYRSPEVVLQSTKRTTCDGCKADVWGCGVMLYFLATGQFPFFDSNNNAFLELQKFSKGNFNFPKNRDISVNCKVLIKKMLDTNPKTRYSIQQVVDDPWFRENLGEDWDRNFESDMRKMQQNLQSEEEIKRIVDNEIKLFDHNMQETCSDGDLSEYSLDFDDIFDQSKVVQKVQQF